MSPTTAATDRRVRHVSELDSLVYDERGLLPVVVQDAGTGDVLMVAWANREALARTLTTGMMHFWSRSRGALWKKGESSGNLQTLVSLHADCDADTILARVVPAGPACHTGEPTCFGVGSRGELPAPRVADAASDEAARRPAEDRGSVLRELWSTLEARARERPEGSYTTRLLADENLRVKKLGEETAELIAALIRADDRIAEEAADLIYHMMVALLAAGRSWDEVEAELLRRRGG